MTPIRIGGVGGVEERSSTRTQRGIFHLEGSGSKKTHVRIVLVSWYRVKMHPAIRFAEKEQFATYSPEHMRATARKVRQNTPTLVGLRRVEGTRFATGYIRKLDRPGICGRPVGRELRSFYKRLAQPGNLLAVGREARCKITARRRR